MYNKEFIEPTKNYYLLNQLLSPNTKICRYMDFDAFIQLIEGTFYVPRKIKFLDCRESGKIPLRLRFAFSGADKKNENREEVNEDQNRINQYVNHLYLSRRLLTSCWMIDCGENYLMWKSYTNKVGVCVRTTIDKLMKAIDFNGNKYLPICSPMLYDNINTEESFLESVLKKEVYYQSEKEIRFYFVPNNGISLEELINMSDEDVDEFLKKSVEKEEKLYYKAPNAYKLFQTFNIKSECIDSVIFSPFIIKESFPIFQEILHKQYGNIFKNNIVMSNISLNNY